MWFGISQPLPSHRPKSPGRTLLWEMYQDPFVITVCWSVTYEVRWKKCVLCRLSHRITGNKSAFCAVPPYCKSNHFQWLVWNYNTLCFYLCTEITTLPSKCAIISFSFYLATRIVPVFKMNFGEPGRYSYYKVWLDMPADNDVIVNYRTPPNAPLLHCKGIDNGLKLPLLKTHVRR